MTTLTAKVYDFVKQHPGTTSKEIATKMSIPMLNASGMLSNLRRGGYIAAEIENIPNGGGRRFHYTPTSKYVRKDGIFHANYKKKTRRKALRRLAGHAVRKSLEANYPVPAKSNGSGVPVLSSRVGIALTMDGKQVVVPVRAAKEVYIQLKEIFA